MPGSRLTFEAIGTVWTIELFDEIPAGNAAMLERSVRSRIEKFDKTYSRFRDDSMVTLMAREAGRYRLPDDAATLLDVYHKLYQTTDGQLTPLIGQTLADAGYDAAYSFKPGAVTAPPKWEDVLEYDHPHLIVKQAALLDFGAAGKGYLADIIAGIIQHNGRHNFCINAGGDFVYRTTSSRTLKIGLEHPTDPDMVIGVAKIHNQSLCGSSGSRRTWDKYHHIINPHTLTSPRDIAAVWVTAENGLIADGVATALFFVSPAKLRLQFAFEYAIVRSDMSLQYSPRFPAEFFTEPTGGRDQQG